MADWNSGYFGSVTNSSVDPEIYMYCTSCKSRLWQILVVKQTFDENLPHPGREPYCTPGNFLPQNKF